MLSIVWKGGKGRKASWQKWSFDMRTFVILESYGLKFDSYPLVMMVDTKHLVAKRFLLKLNINYAVPYAHIIGSCHHANCAL